MYYAPALLSPKKSLRQSMHHSRPQTNLCAHAQRQGGFAALLRDGHGDRAVCHRAGRGHGHAHDRHVLVLLAEIEVFDVMSAETKGGGQVLGFALKVGR